MTTHQQTDLGASQAGDSSSGAKDQAKDQAKQAAGSAAEQSKHVAGVAQEEAARVASEASTQLRGLLEQATSQVEEQSSEQKTRLAETVRSFADDLQSMQSGEQTSGLASQVVSEVAEQTRTLASRLESREPRELLDDVRRFARRRPGSFVLGALAAGVVAGRLTRAGKAAQDSGPSTDVASSSGSAGTHRTVGAPASISADAASTKVAPIPPTDDIASPAYLSEETGTGRP
jgi:uncharacterized protein YjbJ (UPF0337 family)